ncbi:RelA/SpoT family protein [Patescibacteria group bacterium]|nr:RelA/SpoT family protein [Patescibacteria group bacterium]
MTIQQLLNKIVKQNPKADLDLIRLAYDYAKDAHKGQKRASGEDYIQHPLHTASNLVEMGLDEKIIIAGLLHDVPEETSVSIEDIRKNFGKDIATMVAGITKLGKIKYRGMQRYVENLRKMFLAMAKDVRIILIKFADRMHNLSTLDALPEEKRRRIALETLEIYSPIANRLGMGEIKGVLEDLSFPYVLPEEYQWLIRETKGRITKETKYLEEVRREIKKILRKENIKFLSIHGRTKYLYSLYKKLLVKDKDFSKIYDLVALRIIVPTISDCYATLGIIHKYWKPLKGRIKDYIATPKPNGYQSLHTTVFCLNGKLVEFQIRTPEMHEFAEYGIAAHWHYSESGKPKSGESITIDSPSWIKDLVTIQKESKDKKRYLESIKVDIFQNRIFVFTPKGDVIDLPEASTPVDFAFHIHTDIGNKCIGSRVNDKIASLDTTLKSGDMVEIIIDKNRKKPSTDWLSFAKTHLAQEKIRYYNKHKL